MGSGLLRGSPTRPRQLIPAGDTGGVSCRSLTSDGI